MIFLDVDDTLADFRKYCIERGVPKWEGSWYTTPRKTWTEEQHTIQRATQALMDADDFWPNLPVAPGAFELIAAAATRHTTFLLTALPSVCRNRNLIVAQKMDWCQRVLNFPSDSIIVCERAEKVKHAVRAVSRYVSPKAGLVENYKANILIDDAVQNCEEWRAAGGVAHLYTDTRSAIRFLKNT